MAHTVNYNPQTRRIETKVQGILSLEEAKEIVSEIIQAAKDSSCFLCLTDYRDAQLDLSAHEIFGVPRIIADTSTSQGLKASHFKRALVVNESWEEFRFFERATLNSGQHAKLFQDIDEAARWLAAE